MLLIEIVFLVYRYYQGGGYNDTTVTVYFVLALIIACLSIPVSWFLGIFGEIFLIPSFILGLPGLFVGSIFILIIIFIVVMLS